MRFISFHAYISPFKERVIRQFSIVFEHFWSLGIFLCQFSFASLQFKPFSLSNAFTLAHTKKETDSRKKNETIPLQRPKSWEQRISRGIRQDETPRLLELEPEPPVGNDRRFTGRRDRARPEETLPHEEKKVLPNATAVHEVEHSA